MPPSPRRSHSTSTSRSTPPKSRPTTDRRGFVLIGALHLSNALHGFLSKALHAYSNGRGKVIFPSHVAMAKRFHMHVSTVGRNMRALERLGLIEVERSRPIHGPDGRWRRRVNRYRFCVNLHAAPTGRARAQEPYVPNHRGQWAPFRAPLASLSDSTKARNAIADRTEDDYEAIFQAASARIALLNSL